MEWLYTVIDVALTVSAWVAGVILGIAILSAAGVLLSIAGMALQAFTDKIKSNLQLGKDSDGVE